MPQSKRRKQSNSTTSPLSTKSRRTDTSPSKEKSGRKATLQRSGSCVKKEDSMSSVKKGEATGFASSDVKQRSDESRGDGDEIIIPISVRRSKKSTDPEVKALALDELASFLSCDLDQQRERESDYASTLLADFMGKQDCSEECCSGSGFELCNHEKQLPIVEEIIPRLARTITSSINNERCSDKSNTEEHRDLNELSGFLTDLK